MDADLQTRTVSGNSVFVVGGCYGQVASLCPAQSDLASGSLVAAGSLGIVALAEVENKLKVVEEELQLTKDELSVSCKTPWYTVHPVLGCIRLYILDSTLLTPEQWVDKCAEDGGELILINSEAEGQALVELMTKNMVNLIVVQGNKESSTSPWMTDDGQPLPFIGEFEAASPQTGPQRLAFSDNGKFKSVSPSNPFPYAVCET